MNRCRCVEVVAGANANRVDVLELDVIALAGLTAIATTVKDVLVVVEPVVQPFGADADRLACGPLEATAYDTADIVKAKFDAGRAVGPAAFLTSLADLAAREEVDQYAISVVIVLS